jgi:hypothetical protein
MVVAKMPSLRAEFPRQLQEIELIGFAVEKIEDV